MKNKVLDSAFCFFSGVFSLKVTNRCFSWLFQWEFYWAEQVFSSNSKLSNFVVLKTSMEYSKNGHNICYMLTIKCVLHGLLTRLGQHPHPCTLRILCKGIWKAGFSSSHICQRDNRTRPWSAPISASAKSHWLWGPKSRKASVQYPNFETVLYNLYKTKKPHATTLFNIVLEK